MKSALLRTASVFLALLAASAGAQDWQRTLTSPTAGTFPPLRALRATYRFGWSGLTAAIGQVHFYRTGSNRTVLEGKVATVDMARALWPFDAEHISSADVTTLRPADVRENETEKHKQTSTTITFDERGVSAKAIERSKPQKLRRFEIPNLFDLQTALLFLRSQPLANGSSYRIVVFPAKDPYLATITTVGRERITVPAGTYNAIKFDLKLAKIDRNNQLKPHKKFHNASVWLSDDADRLLLRAEAEVFVGSVFGELQSVEFETPRPARD